MIFKTHQLQSLKNLQHQLHNPQLNKLNSQVFQQVWPQSHHNHHFSHIIQSIALKWLNQFINLIQKWITETSQKYLHKLTLFQQLTKPQDKDKFYQYILNLSKFIHSMEHPLITSINNIQSLYLKFPSEQLIQQPKRIILNKSTSFQHSPVSKKKSLSIQSFTSNLPTKSRSKSRKICYFNTIKPNIFQSFNKQFKKTNDTLNTTIKKIKKDLPFTKTSATFHCYSNDQNHRERFGSKQIKADDLRQKLQKKLSNTCSSTFFNQMTVNESVSREESFVNDHKHPLADQVIEKNTKSSSVDKKDMRQLEQDLKKSILQELGRKEKQNYEHLLKDIESKLSNKFDALMNGILRQKEPNERKDQSLQKREDTKNSADKSNYTESFKEPAPVQKYQQQPTFSKNTDHQKQLSLEEKTPKTSLDEITQSVKKQPSICNMLKNEKCNTQPLYQASCLNQVKLIQAKKIHTNQAESGQQNKVFKSLTTEVEKNQTIEAKEIKKDSSNEIKKELTPQMKKDSKVNTSIIVQKDESKIIKSKSKNSSVVKETKQTFIPKQSTKNGNGKSFDRSRSYNNSIDQSNSIDSIQIDQTSTNTNAQSTQNKKMAQHPVLQPENRKSTMAQTKKAQSAPKPQENFYMKRIKELKNKMQNSIKSFKIACDKLVLPVNQTFLLVFSSSYLDFCDHNVLTPNSKQVTDTFSKYKTKAEMDSKKPANDEKFILESLGRIQKMVNLKTMPQKIAKIRQYTQKCLECIENIFYEKPNLKLNNEAELIQKIKQLKTILASSKTS